MKVTIELTEQELRVFRGNCFLRIMKESVELIEYIDTQGGDALEDRISNNVIGIEDTMHHIENIRHKIVEASR